MTLKRRFRPLSGVRGRVFLTVLVATACLCSLLGSFGFLALIHRWVWLVEPRVSAEKVP
jgi:hypothetical protein